MSVAFATSTFVAAGLLVGDSPLGYLLPGRSTTFGRSSTRTQRGPPERYARFPSLIGGFDFSSRGQKSRE